MNNKAVRSPYVIKSKTNTKLRIVNLVGHGHHSEVDKILTDDELGSNEIDLRRDPVIGEGKKASNTNRRRKRRPAKKIYTCQLCNKEFVEISTYSYHMKHNHRKLLSTELDTRRRTYTCFVCNKQFEGLSTYKTHLKRVHRRSMSLGSDGTFFRCPVCKITLRRFNLNIHLDKIHQTSLSQLSPFTCSEPNCERVFARLSNLLYHEKTVHGETCNANPQARKPDGNSIPEKRTSCSKCFQSFPFFSWLVRHEKKCRNNEKLNSTVNIQKPRPFKCAFCPSAFTLNGNKVKHENRFHRNQTIRHQRVDRRNQRKVLQKKYAREAKSVASNLLTVDEPSLTLQSPDKSTLSVSKSSSRVTLTPGGVKMIYADDILCCSYCPKMFATISSKQVHEKIHTGDRPHHCKSCAASFRLQRTLKRHVKKCFALFDSMWCQFCDFPTNSRIKLLAHCEKTHGFDLDEYEARQWKGTGNSESTIRADISRNNMKISEETLSVSDEATSVARIPINVEEEPENIWDQFIIIDDD